MKPCLIRKIVNIIVAILFIPNSYSQDFEVAPVILNFNENPGGIQSRKLTIRNHSADIQTFDFQLGDYELDQNGEKIRMSAGSSEHSVADMITINPALVTLNPNEEVNVDVIVTVPRNVTESKWGMLYVQAAKEQKADAVDKTLATGVLIKPRIAVLITQTPKDGGIYKATIGEFKELTGAQEVPRKFSAVVENLGSTPITAKVNLVLANLETAEEVQYDALKGSVFPKGKREFILSLPQDVKPGRYALGVILDYGHRTALEGSQMTIVVP